MILVGDCIEAMRMLAPNSIDAVVTDPPYGIGFMGQAWDGKDITARAEKRQAHASQDPTAWSANGGHKSAAAAAGAYDLSPKAMRAFQEFSQAWAAEALRVLKPGGHLLSFASPKTYHRMVCGIEEAGFEIRDTLGWMFGSGFPKSRNPCRCVPHVATDLVDAHGWRLCGTCGNAYEVGTGLKPAYEPICLARKRMEGSLETNLAKWGTGGLNIEGCRVAADGADKRGPGAGTTWEAMHRNEGRRARGRDGEASAERTYADAGGTDFSMPPGPRGGDASGRWPANLMHDGSSDVIQAFPVTQGQKGKVTGDEPSGQSGGYENPLGRVPFGDRGDFGSAARFFYCPKISKRDRDEGLEQFAAVTAAEMTGGRKEGSAGLDNPRAGAGRTSGAKNSHPTVKPTELMRYLVRLVTPPSGRVLDPFLGSGSTGKACALEGRGFIGMELDPKWAPIAAARIQHAHSQRESDERAA